MRPLCLCVALKINNSLDYSINFKQEKNCFFPSFLVFVRMCFMEQTLERKQDERMNAWFGRRDGALCLQLHHSTWCRSQCDTRPPSITSFSLSRSKKQLSSVCISIWTGHGRPYGRFWSPCFANVRCDNQMTDIWIRIWMEMIFGDDFSIGGDWNANWNAINALPTIEQSANDSSS